MNLTEGLQLQLDRVEKDVLPVYEEIGPPGIYASVLMKESIKRGKASIASDDVVEMLRAYEDLKGFNL